MHANAAGLLMHDLRNNQHSVVQQFGLDPADLRAYYNQLPDIQDIWTTRASRVTQTGWTGVSQQLCAENELCRSEFYNECLQKLNILHGMFGVIHQEAPLIANISIYRSARLEAFESPDLEMLNFFMPHLRRAFQLHFQLADLQTRNESLQRALDLVSSGVFVFASTGKVQFMNRSASDLLARQDGLFCKGERLRADQPQESAALKFLVSEAIATGAGNGSSPGIPANSPHGFPDIPVTSTLNLTGSVTPNPGTNFRLEGDGNGQYHDGVSSVSSILQGGINSASRDWILDTRSSATRTVLIDLRAPVPNSGATLLFAWQLLPTRIIVKCHETLSGSFLAIQLNQTVSCPMFVRFTFAGADYRLSMTSGPAHSSTIRRRTMRW